MLGEADIPRAPAEIVIGIPVDLLRRRPDIRAAERAIAAQSEQIGIAQADLYPHFSINGEFALEKDFDFLYVDGDAYTGDGAGLDGRVVSAGDLIEFYSDNIEARKGFEVCVTET